MPLKTRNPFPITKAQIRFIDLLIIDMNYNRDKRNRIISGLLNKEIHYLDQLSKYQASAVIGMLLDLREGKKPKSLLEYYDRCNRYCRRHSK